MRRLAHHRVDLAAAAPLVEAAAVVAEAAGSLAVHRYIGEEMVLLNISKGGV